MGVNDRIVQHLSSAPQHATMMEHPEPKPQPEDMLSYEQQQDAEAMLVEEEARDLFIPAVQGCSCCHGFPFRCTDATCEAVGACLFLRATRGVLPFVQQRGGGGGGADATAVA